ncbi:ubiquitin carboxyl-terminal hydrolase, partial [Colletotrichum plurivorum]
ISPAVTPELLVQLVFTTSSSKKRKLSRNQSRDDQVSSTNPADTVLPSCEPNDDPAFSFSAASTDGRSTPTYLRGDSLPASSLPARLQTNSLVSADYASSTASSPCGVADLSIDSDRGGDISGPETGTALTSHSARSRSPFNVSRRAIMTSDANPHQRSSSPLKRRASSMDPDADVTMKEEDVEMTPAQSIEDAESAPPSSKTHLPRAMSVDLPDDAPNAESRPKREKSPPPLEDQIKTIQTLLKAFNEEPPKVGDVAYIVSRSWVERALALGGDPKFARKETSNEPLGPVDNSDLILEVITQSDGTEFVRMKPGTGLEECELFPEDAWTLVSEWYGVKDGQKPIVRRAVNTATDAASPANIVFELNPPIFTIHRLWSLSSPIPIDDELKSDDPPPLVLARSATTPYNAFYKELKKLADIPLERKMRVWQLNQKPTAPAIQGTPAQSALTPPDSPNPDRDSEPATEPWQLMFVEVPTFTKVDTNNRVVVDAVDHTGNPNYNGSSPLSMYGLTQDMTLVLDEEISKNTWVSNYFRGARNEKIISSRGSASSLATQGKASSGRNSPAPGPVTRGRTQQKKPGRGLGAVGLQNLGNTCYMNSALQCVRSVEELTKYFLTNEYEKEINKANALGYKGQVAMAYGNLLKEIYAESRGAVSPRDFKNTVGRARSTFQGWGQQDTQEFLGFLLDALQEDLSRIKKKPYIEKPDSTDEMIGNEEAIRKMAEEVWDITRKRDDSVVADLFTGLYKSTLKCPVCDKISITFDPFNNLTLPLPVEDMWSRTVKFLPLNDAPVQIEIELSKHSAIELLKKAISEKTGVPVELLLGAEEFKGKFFKIYDDHNDVSDEIQSNDVPTFHELEAVPTNFPPKNKNLRQPRSMLDISDEPWVDPRTDRMVVTVLHRKRGGNSSYRIRGDDIVSPPHFIVLTPDEARNEDAIRRKVLEKVATFSTWSEFSDTDDSTDADMVIASQSDADSSGDSKVVSHSVEGEEDLVDVTMVAGEQKQRPSLRQFNTRRPKWVDSKEYLPPQLQNLFELSYFPESSDGSLPTGWNSVEDNRTFRTLASRAPEPATEQDTNSPGSTNSADSEHESAVEDMPSPPTIEEQTRMADESEEDEPVQRIKTNRTRGNSKVAGARRKFVKTKTYGKKGNKRRNKELRNSKEQSYNVVDVAPQPSPEDDIPGGLLVRLGEGIVVDWTEESWDMVFGKDPHSDDDTRGQKTFADPEKLRDPVLEQKRKARVARKKQGITLEECLDEFEKAEVLSEQDMWYCPRCKEHRRASKKFDLWKTPDILVVHLKRFSNAGWRRDKLDVLVDFPIEGLDLHKRVLCQETGKEEIYDLIAVDDHFGGLGGGHYTAYGRNFVDGQWYNYNDTSVSKTSPESVVTRAAYLLFYRRRSDGPLGGPRFKEIFDKFDKGGEEEEDADSGEDQRLVGGSSVAGSSRLGTGAAATLPRGNRGLASSTMSTANRGDDDEPPPYDGSSSTNVGSENIQNSIEDEGIGMADNITGSNGFQATQTWNWNSLSSNEGPTKSLGVEGYASDDAQPDSSDERDVSGHDTDMQFDDPVGDFDDPADHAEVPPPPDFSAQIGLSQIQSAAWERQNKDQVISVPAADDDVASTEAAEIHLDDDDQRPARS